MKKKILLLSIFSSFFWSNHGWCCRFCACLPVAAAPGWTTPSHRLCEPCPREGKKRTFSLKQSKISIQYQILSYLSWFSSFPCTQMPAVSQICCCLACILDYCLKNIGTLFRRVHGKWRMMKTAEFGTSRNRPRHKEGCCARKLRRAGKSSVLFADTSFLTASRHVKWWFSVFSRPVA